MAFSEYKQQLIAACEAAQKDGFSITDCNFGHLNLRCCCPLTALAIAGSTEIWNDQGSSDCYAVQNYARKHMPELDLNSFVSGFDNLVFTSGDCEQSLQLGQELRARFIKAA